MSDTGNIPAAMVEAAARVLSLSDTVYRSYHDHVRAALAAAFAECEVTERWGVAHGGNRPGIDGWLIWGRDEAEARDWLADPETKPGGRLVRRLVITTPPVVVTPAQEGQGT